ncbi:MAG: tRNA preQ1(34) S-adenosylmethionine ribosyltransferase-isomerase QueA [Actinomycetota bacterium]|nr:tRNA preQ1(34) S-adenosylmethionine ribosyltransferase-isomerase QueA [Actinomycetota bacterium]MED5445945.1 tRNA preQ1(34) S-adenosylmethionine ribosyltransferase-isomerase QueA [Actinomycetota bacterium]
MDISNFDYDLPKDSIAQFPLSQRDESKLLVANQVVEHMHTRDFPNLLRPGDVVVLNETKVMPARLNLRRLTGGAVEVLALEEVDNGRWEALVRPSRKIQVGEELLDQTGKAVLRIDEVTLKGTRYISPIEAEMREILSVYGEIPLPPYIENNEIDQKRYQTVYAQNENSVAAPTAGLHITKEIIDRCSGVGASVVTVNLNVGIGTFQPISTDSIDEHVMHSERYSVEDDVWETIQKAKRVIAVGTTVVRTLESVASSGRLEGRTELYIKPGFQFKVVNSLLTNFHLPKSSLLVMIEAFMGKDWKNLYDLALKEGYRFLSFGDAMFIERDR